MPLSLSGWLFSSSDSSTTSDSSSSPASSSPPIPIPLIPPPPITPPPVAPTPIISLLIHTPLLCWLAAWLLHYLLSSLSSPATSLSQAISFKPLSEFFWSTWILHHGSTPLSPGDSFTAGELHRATTGKFSANLHDSVVIGPWAPRTPKSLQIHHAIKLINCEYFIVYKILQSARRAKSYVQPSNSISSSFSSSSSSPPFSFADHLILPPLSRNYPSSS